MGRLHRERLSPEANPLQRQWQIQLSVGRMAQVKTAIKKTPSTNEDSPIDPEPPSHTVFIKLAPSD
jgi:hypothetical protein